MSHVKGQLSIDRYENIKAADGGDFRLKGATLSGSEMSEANTRRLVACWNEHDGLVKERDELVEALRGLIADEGAVTIQDIYTILARYPEKKDKTV